MAEYTAIFTKPYADGYEDLPSQNTPITAQTLNDKDDAIVNIESYLSGNDIPSDAEELSYDNTVSGMTADNVQSAIDELDSEKLSLDDIESQVEVKTNTTGQFSTITGGLMESCVINLELIQSGSGTPSPDNVRPITGHNNVEVDVTDADSNTTQYTVALGQTVYGGSLDVVSGVGSGKYIDVDLGSLTWLYNATYKWFVCVVNTVKATASNADTADGLCSCYGTTNINTLVNDLTADALIAVNTTSTIVIRDLRYTDPTDLKNNALTGMHFVVERATYDSLNFTPSNLETLIGQNTVTTPLDGQSLDSLTYREVLAWDDVERAVSVKLDLSSVAPIEYTDKASQSYNQKQLFIKDNKLCQALASISSGASFTENTNFKYTTLAEIIEPLIP